MHRKGTQWPKALEILHEMRPRHLQIIMVGTDNYFDWHTHAPSCAHKKNISVCILDYFGLFLFKFKIHHWIGSVITADQFVHTCS